MIERTSREYVLEHLQKNHHNWKILDIGCNQDAVEYAQTVADTEDFSKFYKDKKFILIDGKDLPFENNEFDFVYASHVIEHVEDPVNLLQLCYQQLKPNGILLVNTPDSKSLLALALRYKWWHYRIAHIGYFSKKTLKLAFDKSGFKILDLKRPTWYFELGYLYARIRKYIGFLPSFENSDSKLLGYLFHIKIPLNLKDSLEVIVCKK